MAIDILIHPEISIGRIRPELHGHFLEHLGTATYGGLWVGHDSATPNIRGFRRDALEFLKALGVPVLRWPGGCFADNYHWRDGIGDPILRPKTVNKWWGGTVEDNSFGTHEFVELCHLIGAEPYFAGNVGSGSPAELRDWVEYCNFPGGSMLADMRIRNGHTPPFGVRFWGIGNESWGCGGFLTAAEYCALYSRFATFVPEYGNTTPFMIACGPNSNDTSWTREFLETLKRQRQFLPPLHGFAMHYYSWGKSTSLEYTPETMTDQLSTFDGLERAIKEQRAYLDALSPDREHPLALILDEWGTWDLSDQDLENTHGKFWQHNTMKDGLAAALGLNVFHRQADKLFMCNLAQIANVLQAPLLTYGDHCTRTPTYHAFRMMRHHKNQMSVRVDNPCVPARELSVSASTAGESLVLTLVNPDAARERSVRCTLTRGRISEITGTLLHHSNLNAANIPGETETVTPAEYHPEASQSSIELELPPLSVVTLQTLIK